MTGTTATEKIEDVPNQPKTPARAVRIGDDLWDEVIKEAEQRGEYKSDVVRRALRQYFRLPQEGTE